MPEIQQPHLRVPVLPLSSGSGYDWMEKLTGGWRPVAAWGLNGWDLGSWPLVIVCVYTNRAEGVYAVVTYTEGDLDIKAFDTAEERDAEIDEIAAWFWRHGGVHGPPDLPPEGEPLLPQHRGPFSWKRWEAEKRDGGRS